jgi:hypothetical protein
MKPKYSTWHYIRTPIDSDPFVIAGPSTTGTQLPMMTDGRVKPGHDEWRDYESASPSVGIRWMKYFASADKQKFPTCGLDHTSLAGAGIGCGPDD